MDYKLTLVDLDGTLLNKAGNIPKKHLNVLKKYSDMGGKIAICTGRWPVSAKFFNSQIQEYIRKNNDYMISLNGAVISNPNTGKIFFNSSIDEEIFKKLLLIREKFKVAMWIYSKEGIASKIIHTFQIPFKKLISKFNYGKVVSHDKFSTNIEVLKILFIHWNKKRIEKVYEWLTKYFSNYLTISKTSSNNLEVTAYKTSKGYALDKMSMLLNIPKSEIAVFGDSGNDASMFEKAGLKICIGEKNRYLMDLSNAYVGKSDGGFSKAISEYLLNDFPRFNNKDVSVSLKWNNLDSLVPQRYFTKKKYFWNYLVQQNKLNLFANNPLWINLGYLKSFVINRNSFISSGNFNSLFSVKKNEFIFAKTFTAKEVIEIKEIIHKLFELDNLIIIVEWANLLPSLFYKNTYSLGLMSKDLSLNIDELIGSTTNFIWEKFLNNFKKSPVNISVWSSDKKIRKYSDAFLKKFRVSLHNNCLTFYPLDGYEKQINNYLYSDILTDNLYSIDEKGDQEYENIFSKLDEILKNDF
ncbi:MAG: Cof-type HAD-IIB family hydrolase [Mycoplasma sp.]|nr:Cof-type HAD-IIB family hydrolase [Mycoplasma sp.]